MCGIVAVLRRPSERPPPDLREVIALVEEAQHLMPSAPTDDRIAAAIGAAAERLEDADRLLRGAPGARALLRAPTDAGTIEGQIDDLGARIRRLEDELDVGLVEAASGDLEAVNSAMVRLKDAVWAVGRDRLGTARATGELAGPDPSPSAVDAFCGIAEALSAIDRLEVRGRDSAGLHVLVTGHGLDPSSPSVRSLLDGRIDDPLFRSGAVRTPEGHLAFVYKAAAEIGELGDNTAVLRRRIAEDALLHRAVSAGGARAHVLGHTRWASVGIISEANAHPLNHEEDGRSDGPYVAAALNGDVDNHADLKVGESIVLPDEVTTDAKVIPVLTSRRIAEGGDPSEAFRKTVASLDGSVAIAACAGARPGEVLLALRGSGQALYVGLAEDAFIVASEPYGLVESCDRYLRMDGETPRDPTDPTSSRGQIVALDADRAGSVDGIRRLAYDGTELPVSPHELQTPEITTRDIDRGEHRHYLLKEISESPVSFRKTLRGKVVEHDGALDVVLGADTLPDDLVAGLKDGRIRQVLVIGQGTAHVAGLSLAEVLGTLVDDLPMRVRALPATELSGFNMRDEMSDTLVIAISQSGTTTDTNRTVDLARGRGASVVSIVNRRQSDLVDRSDGVLYTSDGRDVEMAVPSTKAFYAQIAAGFLLAFAIAEHLGVLTGPRRQELLRALRELPTAMEEVLGTRGRIGEIARRHAPYRRYWAIVGNGHNRVAAEEVRIKLSELCYKSIACDVTEDKKHIDLSAEPMILVCGAGLEGSNADDVAKEIAIYRAHKAAPIVIASEGDVRFQAAVDVIWVPAVHPDVAFVLSAMAGHLFGYEAALAIDEQARPFREARVALKDATSDGAGVGRLLERLGPTLEPISERFFEGLRTGAYDGHLEASTAVRLTSLFRYATGVLPLEVYQVEHGKVGTPAVVADDLMESLTRAVEELTRPIDAIKHQAKTVTVGISRADETFLQIPLVQAVLEAGAGRDRLSYRVLRALGALDPAVERVTGYTHYEIEGDPASDDATIRVVDRGGIAADIPSRTDQDPRLRGTKRRVAIEREALVTRGRSDDRTILIVPETKGNEVTGITLLHTLLHDHLGAQTMRSVLDGYRDRYAALTDLVTETEPTFRDDLLADVGVVDLLTESIQRLADRWRSG